VDTYLSYEERGTTIGIHHRVKVELCVVIYPSSV
jgi:hypothetical protein